MPIANDASGDVCDKPTCRTRARMDAAARVGASEQARELAWRKATEARVAEPMRAVISAAGGDDPDAVARAIVPYIELPLVPVPPGVLSDFRTHLDRIIAESFAEEEVELTATIAQRRDEADPDPLALNAACIACQGKCCLQGRGRRAFLTRDSIDFVRTGAPDLMPDEIRDTYLDHLPDRSVSGSCVYHGPQGCVLRRDWRAGICNRFQCSARQVLAAEIAEKGADRAAVIGVADDHLDHPEEGAPYFRPIAITAEDEILHLADLVFPAVKGKDG